MKPNGIQLIEPNVIQSMERVKEVVIERISDRVTDTSGLNISIVSFPPGTRRPWSSHSQDQYVWIISGKGIITSMNGEAELNSGTLIFVPAYSKHQHGASEEIGMTQLSIIGGDKPRETRLSQEHVVI
jgi:quercetin dioxygenase-like cupin family protein